MKVVAEIEDLRVLAQKRVPRMFYEFADSGSWTEGTYRSNQADFQKILLRQRVARNLEGAAEDEDDRRRCRHAGGDRSHRPCSPFR